MTPFGYIAVRSCRPHAPYRAPAVPDPLVEHVIPPLAAILDEGGGADDPREA
jgi:hypothetical protein